MNAGYVLVGWGNLIASCMGGQQFDSGIISHDGGNELCPSGYNRNSLGSKIIDIVLLSTLLLLAEQRKGAGKCVYTFVILVRNPTLKR